MKARCVRKWNDGMRGQRESVMECGDWKKGLEMKAVGSVEERRESGGDSKKKGERCKDQLKTV